MNRNPRRAASSASGQATGELYRVAIVGAGSLKGKELAEVLPDSALPTAEVKLLDDDETLGQLETVGDEVTFVQSVSRDNFENVDFAFFASRPDFTRRFWRIARQAGAAVVDLSYALEEEPGASVRAPWIERELGQSPPPELEPGPVVAAHPAAVVLALLLLRANRAARIRSAIATIFDPASEHGRAGMDELHEQTVNLLSFQEMPRNVFDAQVAFNLVARLGEKSAASALEATERRILNHFRRIAAVPASSTPSESAVLAASGPSAFQKPEARNQKPATVPVPSVMLVQAPIFHGHVFSLYIELEETHSVGDFVQALAGEHVAVTRIAEETPSNVAAAGQEEVLVSVRHDAQREPGFWIWAAADNLRVQALTAIECAQRLAAARPKGKVQ